MTLKGVQVGDTLFAVYERLCGVTVLDDGLTVTKVGRRWVTALHNVGAEHRFDIPTGRREDFYPAVTAFRSEADGLAYVADLIEEAEEAQP
jgi:hypothetical protein